MTRNALKWHHRQEGRSALPTFGTINNQSIATFGFTLKERAPMLHKLFRFSFGFKFATKMFGLFFDSGLFLLKLSYLLLDDLRLLSDEKKTFFDENKVVS